MGERLLATKITEPSHVAECPMYPPKSSNNIKWRVIILLSVSLTGIANADEQDKTVSEPLSAIELDEVLSPSSPLDSWGDWGELPPELEEAFSFDPAAGGPPVLPGVIGPEPTEDAAFGVGVPGSDELLLNELDGSLITDPWNNGLLMPIGEEFDLIPVLPVDPDPDGR